ncbi:uncharacterized protein [Diadema antillarum]|uniref:uncharacterized protein n=1 Tax=Diadema antillarum TaxID=105358 RepID=UPI003A87BCAD
MDAFNRHAKGVQTEVDQAKSQLFEVKEEECRLQAMKEELLGKKRELGDVIEARTRSIHAVRERLPTIASKKLFDDVFSIVESCYHQQLHILELTEQLTLAKALRRESDCAELIEGLSPGECRAVTENEPSILVDWYKEMKLLETDKSDADSLVKDKTAYHLKLSSDRISAMSTISLSFFSMHKGYCIHLNITEERLHIPSDSISPSGHFTFTSDPQLEGLQEKGTAHLAKGETAAHFVSQVLWPLMEEQMTSQVTSV